MRHAKTLALLLLTLLPTVATPACAGPAPNRDPVGEPFPRVTGQTLEERPFVLPDDLGAGPTVLLVGYVQGAQFDIDRWILGLMQAGTPARILEVPTIDSWVAGLFAGSIDDGMRGGIPREDWASVVTVYDEAERITALTGEAGPRNARVLLLDEDGVIRWFHDRGYSAGVLLALDEAVGAL